MLNNAGTRSKNARIAQIDKEGTDEAIAAVSETND